MTTFAQSYLTNKPAGGDLVSTGDDFLREQWVAINERYSLEHKALDSEVASATSSDPASAGMHIPGKVSAVSISNNSTMEALPDISGRMAITTDTPFALCINNGTNWTANQIPMSNPKAIGAAIAYVGDTQTVSSKDYADINLTGEVLDAGSAELFATKYYTAPFTGFYHVDLVVQISGSNSLDATKVIRPRTRVLNSTTGVAMQGEGSISCLLGASATNVIKFQIAKMDGSHNFDIDPEAGTLYGSYMCIHCVCRGLT